MNTKRLFKLVILPAVAALLLVSLLTLNTSAQDADEDITGGTGFRVSPARFDLALNPGESAVRTVEVRNVTNTNQRGVPVVNDFIASDDESGNPQLVTDDSSVSDYAYSIKPLVAPLDTFTLAPDEIENVNVIFTAPDDLSPGAYYGVVRFVAETEEGTEGDGNVALTASVGTIFLVNVPGSTVEKLSLVELSASNVEDGNYSPGRFFNSAPSHISVRLENEGNTFIAPFGAINVKDWTGNIVQTIELNDSEPPGNILPASIRRFDLGLDGIGSIGRYTVETFISYGEGGSSIISAETTFWVIPWFRILVFASLVIVVVYAGTKGVRTYNRRIVERSKGSKKKK